MQERLYTGVLGIEDMWKWYHASNKDHPQYNISKRLYKDICYAFNKAVVNYLVYEAGVFVLFGKRGKLFIQKGDFNKPRVDHAATRALRKQGDMETVIYYFRPVRYYWRWDKRTAILENKEVYYFIPARYSALRKPYQAKKEDSDIDYFE